MSRSIGLKIFNLEMTERVGRTEYIYHGKLVQKETGLDPSFMKDEQREKAYGKFFENLVLFFKACRYYPIGGTCEYLYSGACLHLKLSMKKLSYLKVI